ncbi:OmpA family protein [Sneathiella marina]|uniref:OmpA family protein n=1 Tax=Sneathiella marina TaxID=2950108 RepID=A0ABY4VZ31_9PROT|nr:OmpA family protein [Sneathiella marina]USG59896.1 OmpA family protein [Sneathiella marina]
MIGREHLARSLKHQKKETRQTSQGAPRAAAFTFYQHFLKFCSFKNHRFSATIILMVAISSMSIYHAGEKARETRNCIIDAVKNDTASPVTSAKLYPGLNIANLCKVGDEHPFEEVNLFLSFARTMGEFFTFPVVLFDIPSMDKPVIFLGSTERFDLFFNGGTRLPFAVPVQSLQSLFSRSSENANSNNPSFTELRNTVEKNGRKVANIAIKIAERPLLNSSVLKSKISRIEERTDRSSTKLRQLELGLDKFSNELFQMEKKSNDKIALSIPANCWNSEPNLILPFDVSAVKISSLIRIRKVKELAGEFIGSENQIVVISGFSDPTGPYSDNDRLSHQRAAEVKSLMLQSGLNAASVYSVGHGENFSTHLPRRRVEIRKCTLPPQRQIN